MKNTSKIKELKEKHSALLAELDTMLASLDSGEELREFTDEEQTAFNEKKSQAEAIGRTISALRERRDMENFVECKDGHPEAVNSENEERAFENYLRHNTPMETRAESNWTASANGAVLPTSIANKIIDKVKEISPLYSLATHYNVGGTLNIPYYDESTSTLSVAYADEFSELEGSAASFKSIALGGYLVGALSKISKSLINNSNFPIVDYVIGKIAEAVALWIDKELINGTDSKIDGLKGVTQTVTAASSSVITADELMDVQDSLPDLYQPGAVWIMSKAARSAIRKLKDGDGNYLLNKDATTKWGYTLFGKPVYISDAVDKLESGKTPIYYGDFSGLAVKVSEGLSLQLLLEKYATQHVIGAVAWFEMDAKVENAQKIAKLVMA